MIKTTTILPPAIKQYFDSMLLDPLRGMFLRSEKVVLLAKRKIRTQDVGKRREFDKLWKEYEETYERKKTEEAEYNAKIKEATKERRSFPTSGRTCVFKRFQCEKTSSGIDDGD